MGQLPTELKYAPTHEWVKQEGNGVIRVGITDFAQEQLGDVVYIKLPENGTQVKAGAPVAVIESVKAASDIHSPVTGQIVEVNAELSTTPERINEEPYSAWMFCIQLTEPLELDRLLDATGYQQTTEA